MLNFATNCLSDQEYIAGDQDFVSFYYNNVINWRATIDWININLNKVVPLEWQKVFLS